jgi:hypothetical protein
VNLFRVILEPVEDPADGRIVSTLLGVVQGDRTHLETILRHTVKSFGTASVPGRQRRRVRTLWYEPKVANVPLDEVPDLGVDYDSMGALSAVLAIPYTTLSQTLANYRHRGFVGGVYRGLAYAYVDQIEKFPGKVPAIRRAAGDDSVEVIFAENVVVRSAVQSPSDADNVSTD